MFIFTVLETQLLESYFSLYFNTNTLTKSKIRLLVTLKNIVNLGSEYLYFFCIMYIELINYLLYFMRKNTYTELNTSVIHVISEQFIDDTHHYNPAAFGIGGLIPWSL